MTGVSRTGTTRILLVDFTPPIRRTTPWGLSHHESPGSPRDWSGDPNVSHNDSTGACPSPTLYALVDVVHWDWDWNHYAGSCRRDETHGPPSRTPTFKDGHEPSGRRIYVHYRGPTSEGVRLRVPVRQLDSCGQRTDSPADGGPVWLRADHPPLVGTRPADLHWTPWQTLRRDLDRCRVHHTALDVTPRQHRCGLPRAKPAPSPGHTCLRKATRPLLSDDKVTGAPAPSVTPVPVLRPESTSPLQDTHPRLPSRDGTRDSLGKHGISTETGHPHPRKLQTKTTNFLRVPSLTHISLHGVPTSILV